MILNVPIVRQATPASCGPACLFSLLKYWLGDGAPAKEEDLYELVGFDPKVGTEPYLLAYAARRHGLSAEACHEATVEELVRAVGAGWTVILDVYNGDLATPTSDARHYVVAVDADEEKLTAMDPALPDGYHGMSFDGLRARWRDGVAVCVRGQR